MRGGWFFAMLLAAAPAGAEVTHSGAGDFTSEHQLTIAAPPAAVWRALVEIGGWWSDAHSYSGKAANLTLAAQAGGCWCETLPDGGSVEHMRVVHVVPGRMLRMTGGLGPFQGESVTGVLTVTLAPAAGNSTALVATFRVAGAVAGAGLAAMAAPVDGVLGEQFVRLKRAAEQPR